LLVPLAALLTALDDGFFVLFIPLVLTFFFGLARLLHAYLLAQNTPKENVRLAAAQPTSLPATSQTALPAGQTIPVTNWRQPVNTSEMAQPLSVTENTTRLLNDERK
jgi:hypothetical protein